MRRTLLFVLMISKISSFYAQPTNVFEWSNGNDIPNNNFIEITKQPSESRLASAGYTTQLYHSFVVRSSNNEYECQIKILGQNGVNEDEHHRYELFCLVNNNGSTIVKRYGAFGPLTTTRWLSGNIDDNNYFRKIDLDDDSYALFFAGWFYYYDNEPGEMIIVVVSKNVATIVYHGYAVAITPTDFNSNNFSMDFVKDATGLVNPNTGFVDITPDKLVGRTKYRLYKEGNMLKITSWQ
jgi:hypothetical protein